VPIQICIYRVLLSHVYVSRTKSQKHTRKFQDYSVLLDHVYSVKDRQVLGLILLSIESMSDLPPSLLRPPSPLLRTLLNMIWIDSISDLSPSPPHSSCIFRRYSFSLSQAAATPPSLIFSILCRLFTNGRQRQSDVGLAGFTTQSKHDGLAGFPLMGTADSLDA
jgi:hypothetical protein